MNKSDIALELARKEFEEWAKGPKLPLKRDRTLYAEYMTQLAWDAWKAALLRPHVWQWIPVGERLPHENNEYLVSENEVGVTTADWRDGEWFTVRSFGQDCEERPLYSVTHWTSLPSAPLSQFHNDPLYLANYQRGNEIVGFSASREQGTR